MKKAATFWDVLVVGLLCLRIAGHPIHWFFIIAPWIFQWIVGIAWTLADGNQALKRIEFWFWQRKINKVTKQAQDRVRKQSTSATSNPGMFKDPRE